MTAIRKKTVDYKLKLDPDLHRWLKMNAADNYRTLSSEMLMHLDKARKAHEQGGKHHATN